LALDPTKLDTATLTNTNTIPAPILDTFGRKQKTIVIVFVD
jgi:hypothetical protein